ncbi:hypothetical protein R1flu_015791 [Riccia fluitans]|uniref:Uncharacterized protein n=1 Tax=Riccia fluitans TaxID=41844 RepID=A0ABD1YKU1_9MARC
MRVTLFEMAKEALRSWDDRPRGRRKFPYSENVKKSGELDKVDIWVVYREESSKSRKLREERSLLNAAGVQGWVFPSEELDSRTLFRMTMKFKVRYSLKIAAADGDMSICCPKNNFAIVHIYLLNSDQMLSVGVP